MIEHRCWAGVGGDRGQPGGKSVCDANEAGAVAIGGAAGSAISAPAGGFVMASREQLLGPLSGGIQGP
jgi:hypothetical protein